LSFVTEFLPVVAQLVLLFFPLVMLFAAAMDVFTLRIANVISLTLVAVFIVAALALGMPFEQILVHVGVGFAALLGGMVLFHLRLFGGGDAKLLAAASMWVGYDLFNPFFMYVTIFGGVLALLLIGYRWLPVGAFPLPDWASRLHNQGEAMPYGVAITAGALAVYPMTAIPMLLAS
jgi:prepilin peptidase CpaA